MVNTLLWYSSISETCQDSSRGGFAELRELCPCWGWGGSQLDHLSVPGRSCAHQKAGRCSPTCCCKHMQVQLLITGSRLLIGIKLQSFMGIQQPPEVFVGAPTLPCSSQGAAVWIPSSGEDSVHREVFHLEVSSCATWHQDIPDQPPDLYFEAFIWSSCHEDTSDHPQIFTWRLSAVLHGMRMSLITPKSCCQRENLVWGHLAPVICHCFKRDTSQHCWWLSGPQNLHIGVLSGATSYHTW